MITIDINRDDENEKLYFEKEAPLLLKVDNEAPLECFIEKALLIYNSKDIYDGSGTLITKFPTRKIEFIINSKGNFSKSNWFKKGKWLEEDGFQYCSYDKLWKCSECGFISTSKMNFCGGCGAIMGDKIFDMIILDEKQENNKKDNKNNKGQWINTGWITTENNILLYEYICNKCNGISYFRKNRKEVIGANYCSVCGADMKKV